MTWTGHNASFIYYMFKEEQQKTRQATKSNLAQIRW